MRRVVVRLTGYRPFRLALVAAIVAAALVVVAVQLRPHPAPRPAVRPVIYSTTTPASCGEDLSIAGGLNVPVCNPTEEKTP